MRLTEFRKAWIYKEIRNRVEQIGMPNQEIPRIIMTRKDWLALPKELTHGLRTTTHKNLGIIKPRSRIMFLNVRSHRSLRQLREDRKSTRLNSSHLVISYAVFCLKKKNN